MLKQLFFVAYFSIYLMTQLLPNVITWFRQVYEPPGKLISYRIVRRYVRKNWLRLAHHAFLVCVIYPAVLFARDDEVNVEQRNKLVINMLHCIGLCQQSKSSNYRLNC